MLDLETTGLDITNSSIIEVGALLVSGDEIKDRYVSFVRYDGKLPDTTKRITGITDSMLKGAPILEEVVKHLRDFIQKRPVIAHNGFSFDFRMLDRAGLKIVEKYDSMEFAFFVLPTSTFGHGTAALAKRFSLGAVPHRALQDCEIEFMILQKLRDEWNGKNRKKMATLKFFAEYTGWWWAQFLTGKSENADIASLVDPHVPYRKKDAEQNKLVLTQPIDLVEVERYFSPGAGVLEYSENRPEQRSMARFVAEAFNEKRRAVVEAGTGVGKSKAYLVPSVLFALKNDIPVVISTYTKALQDQLAFKEIKHVCDTVKPDLRVAVIKGKQNYVCLTKFGEFADEAIEELAQRSLYEHAEEDTRYTTRLAFVLLSAWILETERGDWDELPYWLVERIPKRIMQDICNLDELCARDVCKLFDEKKCFYAKARLRAKDADLVIMNHAILLTGLRRKVVHREDAIKSGSDDVITEEITFAHPVLPTEAKFVIFDEAHHLEDAATSAWTLTLSQALLERLLYQLYDERRGARKIMYAIISSSNNQRLQQLGVTFDGIEKDLRLDIRTLFKEILEKIIPFDPSAKWDKKLSFSELTQTPEHMKPLSLILLSIRERLAHISTILMDFSQRTTNEELKKALVIRSDLTERLMLAIDKIAGVGDYHVRYIERSGSVVQIHAAPLSIAQEMKSLVYDTFNSVIMTSATITVDDKFNFFAHRCGTDLIEGGQIKYLQRSSSFDYSRQVQFFVPKGISYASGREEKKKHAQQCLEFLKEAIVASQGGSLILCSSHEQVDQLYNGLADHLSSKNIWLLRQSKDMSITSVVRDFSNDINSVLIGTASLWQGVDVPGPSLRSLFIYKIPYKVFTEPLIKARREEIQRQGQDSYATYYEPLAALDLKQGFGRLIRKKTDIGIAVLLDEKIMQKDILLKSFPPGVKIISAEPQEIFSALSELAKTVDVKEAKEQNA